MPELLERLDGGAHVKGSLVASHLAWAEEHLPDSLPVLRDQLPPLHREVFEQPILDSVWISFASAVALDRAIAALAGGDPLEVYDALGRASARHNLEGTFRSFQEDDPHHFFSNSAQLHDRFQDFGAAHYEEAGERQGRFHVRKSTAFSPVHCAGARGYLAEALIILGVTDSPTVTEVTCRCAGDAGCTFELSW